MIIPWDTFSTPSFIGFILLIAVGFSVSTVPIISVILLLLSDKHPIKKALGFLLGHYLGVLLVAIGSYLLIQNFPPINIETGDSTLNIVLNILIGIILVFIASKLWKNRYKVKPNKYQTKILGHFESLSFISCIAIAFLLLVTGMRNWILIYITTSALIIVDLGVATELVILISFLIISGITILIPVIISIVLGKRIQPSLFKFKLWLTKNSNSILAVALFIAGIFILFKSLLELIR